ncbi:hypothetical protein niasHT_034786 [Heterodera trifolii]|uniref:TATA-box binding protein n=1 Tax=Heterodera trifolii TaxID=157864 RepID=A0ABD2IRY8_9BILA
MKVPEATAIIFSTGKFVCTGAMGEIECREAAEQVAERIRQCGYQEARIHEFAVKNFMATADRVESFISVFVFLDHTRVVGVPQTDAMTYIKVLVDGHILVPVVCHLSSRAFLCNSVKDKILFFT